MQPLRSLPLHGHSRGLLLCLLATTISASELQVVELVLPELVPQRHLQLSIGLRGGLAELAHLRGYSAFPGLVSELDLQLNDSELRGTLHVPLPADPWFPADGQDRSLRLQLRLERGLDDQLQGVYEASIDDQAATQGICSGAVRPCLAPRTGAWTVRIHQALYRLAPGAGSRGPNTGHALDLYLRSWLSDGRSQAQILESVVPDYRGYSAQVEELQATCTDFMTTLHCRAVVDHHRQERPPRREIYSYTLQMQTIGDSVAGSCRIEVGELQATVPCWGSYQRAPPPGLDAGSVWLHLHGAARDETPLLLALDQLLAGGADGYAYLPRYNHQVHAVEATDLRWQTQALQGPLRVQVFPDVYHDQDLHFSLEAELQATVAHGLIEGSFTATDQGQERRGILTGRVEARAPVVRDSAFLDAITVDCGAVVRGAGDAGMQKLQLLLQRDESNEWSGMAELGSSTAPVQVTRLQFQGAHAAIDFQFSLPASASGLDGTYTFQTRCLLDGTRGSGFWRGERNGTALLTKSAKCRLACVPGRRVLVQRLQLADYFGPDKDLQLFLRRDAFGAHGFGLARRYSRSAAGLDLQELTMTNESVAGSLQLQMASDGWVPPPGETLQESILLGPERWQSGERHGSILALPVDSFEESQAGLRLRLHLDRGISSEDDKMRRGTIELAFRDGSCSYARLAAVGSPTDTAFQTQTIAQDLRLDNGFLLGSLRFLVFAQGQLATPREHVYGFRLPLIDRHAAGHLRLQVDSREPQTTPVVVDFVDTLPAHPAEADHLLVLATDLPERIELYLRVRLRDGKATAAILSSPNYNNSIHAIDDLQVEYQQGSIHGSLDFTLRADPWKPADGQHRRGRLQFQAHAADGALRGRASGELAGVTFTAPVLGESDALSPAAQPDTLTLKLEDALQGKVAFKNRAFLNLRLRGEEILGGKLSNNHSDLAGKVSAGRVAFRQDGLEVDVTFEASGEGITGGAYRARVTLQQVGDLLAGTFTCIHVPSGEEKPGTAWARLR